MEHHELESSMVDAIAALRKAGARLERAGRDYAESERDYRRLLARKLAELSAEGKPASLAGDLARGDEAVSEAKCKRDLAEAAIGHARSEIRLHEARIEIARTLDVWERKAYDSPGAGEGGFGR